MTPPAVKLHDEIPLSPKGGVKDHVPFMDPSSQKVDWPRLFSDSELAPGVNVVEFNFPVSRHVLRKYLTDPLASGGEGLHARLVRDAEARGDVTSEILASDIAMLSQLDSPYPSAPAALPLVQHRMVAVRCGQGGLILYDPMPFDSPDAVNLVSSWGRPAVVIIPSAEHHESLLLCKKAFPSALYVAPHGFTKVHPELSSLVDCEWPDVRDESQTPDSSKQRQLLTSLVENQGASLHLVAPVLNEITLYHAPSKTLACAELVLARKPEEGTATAGAEFEAFPGPPESAFFRRLMASVQFNPSPNRLLPLQLFEAVGQEDRDTMAARTALDESIKKILNLDIDRLQACHLSCVSGDGAAQRLIRDSWKWLSEKPGEIILSPRAGEQPAKSAAAHFDSTMGAVG